MRCRFFSAFFIALALVAGVLHASGSAEAGRPQAALGSRSFVGVPGGFALPDRLPPHPRLVADREDFGRLEDGLRTDPVLKGWYAALKKEADRALTQAPYRYELRDGVRLLSVSRDILRRVSVLALVYKVEKKRPYFDRAFEELRSAAAFPDWHPVHFLDTAELCYAFALAYDWLYTDLSADQKNVLRRAVRIFALDEAVKVYRSKKGWPSVSNNWNFVCNGGVLLGALAIADEDPEILGTILPEVVASLPKALVSYAPDGAWNESPAYWDYGTSYLVYLLAGLENSLGTAFGFTETPGLESTGDFAVYLSGPGNYQFGYGDIGSSRSRVSSEALWYLARLYGADSYARARRDAVGSKPEALDLLWYDAKFFREDGAIEGAGAADSRPKARGLAEPPLDRLFRGVEVATFRSSWTDPEALFVGVKGTGTAERNHTDLDSGSFFLACFGEIWATDLGSDDYNLPGYFNMSLNTKNPQMRWDYYRKRAEGHNTLVINPGLSAVRDLATRPGLAPDQDPRALAPVEKFRTGPDGAFAVIDLSAAYPGGRSLKRGIRLFDSRSRILVQDEIRLKEAGEILWFLHLAPGISAKIDPTRTRATLTKKKEGRELRLDAVLLGVPEGLGFELTPARPLPTSPQIRQNENADLLKLSLRASGKKDLDLRVLLVPSAGDQSPDLSPPAPQNLAEW